MQSVCWQVDHLWSERVVERVEMQRGELAWPGRTMVPFWLPLLLLMLLLLLLLLHVLLLSLIVVMLLLVV